jgi:hypothetical protein
MKQAGSVLGVGDYIQGLHNCLGSSPFFNNLLNFGMPLAGVFTSRMSMKLQWQETF